MATSSRLIACCFLTMLSFACGRGTGLATSSDDIVVCPRAVTVQGLDVSHYQGGIDWNAVAGSGRVFGIAAVGDGYYRDPSFAGNWSGMREAGLIRGAYQFFEPNLDPAAQADILIDAVGGSLGAGDLPPMLDIEYAEDGTPPSRILWAMQVWADRVEQALGKKPMIYTGAWWWNPWTSYSGQFAGYPLVDSYYAQTCPNIAAGWSSWAFWQYSSSGRVPGINGDTDLDAFNGSLEELRAFAGQGDAPGGGQAGPCSGREAGLWCGAALGLDAGTLYSCDGGDAASPSQACAYGCQQNPPGTNDACNAPPSGPCTGRQAGLWCGSELGLEANTLYSCDGGEAATPSQVCAAGCQVNPPGVDDRCIDANCAGQVDGAYCGASIGGSPEVLFWCEGGAVSSSSACSNGCVIEPPGVNDHCG